MKHKLLNLFTILFLGSFILILFNIANSQNQVSKMPFQPLQNAENHSKFNKEFHGIAKVIDGDSIKVGKNEARLLGIDAPEYKQTCLTKNKKTYHCGKISSNFLRKLAHNKKVKCIYYEKDIYNRFLSKCFINNLSINKELVKSGMAVIYDFSTSSKEMNDLESSAKKQKIGIWQGPFQLPKDYRRSQKR